MNFKTLSPLALEVINQYAHLPFKDKNIPCPYFNNRRSKVRAGLRVLLGKGSPIEIVDEALLFALREKVNLHDLNNESLKKFLIDHNLGVDCSAFAYYIMEAEYRQKGKGLLSSKFSYPHARNIFRKLIVKLRAVENIGVATLAYDKNSHPVDLSHVQPGDMVIMINSGKEHNLNHVLLAYKVDYEDEVPIAIYYCHSFQWSMDGRYNHGIKTGIIEITDVTKPLLAQTWKEASKEAGENETFLRAAEAEALELRRLNF